MKITFVVAKLNLTGGGENHDIFAKAKSLHELGHEVTMITAFSKLNNLSANIPFPVIEEFFQGSSFLSFQFFIINIFKKYSSKTDIFYVVGNSFIFGSAWYCLTKRGRKKVVVDLNGYADFVEGCFRKEPLYPATSLDYKRGLFKKIKFGIRIFLERALGIPLINCLDSIIFISTATAEYYFKVGVKKNKSVVVPGFHDIVSMQAKRSVINPYNQYPIGTFHILSTGRLHVDKGFDILIRAFAQCHCPQAMLHIVGDGPEKDMLQKMVSDLGLDNVVRFHPWQSAESLLGFNQNANLFIYPARLPEVMVRVTVEAMAQGVPLVLPDTSAETWIGKEVAKIFKNGQITDLKEKIELAFFDIEWQKSAGNAGRKRALEFDYRHLVLQLEKVLLSVK